MKRRQFLMSAVAGGAAGRSASAAQQVPKRPYKPGVELSLVALGGIVVVGMEQKDANSIVAEAFDRGVNYFDVAPSYGKGEAEQKLGPALEPYRKRVFLACKTQRRDAEGARMELEQSLNRLRTDHFDLYQFHAVTTMKDVEEILAPRGAGEVFLKARDEGKVRFLGFSAHSAEAALALMDRFRFDSILFPVNFVCYAQGNFGPQILAHAKEKGVARLALKALAYTRWPQGTTRTERKYPKCWYKPVDDAAVAKKALRFTLSEDITAAVPPGDERLFRMALEIASEFKPLNAAERRQLLAGTKSVEPIFKA
jgi:aryl-alcohol dehydrogenase-like predicted oxidoreductase